MPEEPEPKPGEPQEAESEEKEEEVGEFINRHVFEKDSVFFEG